LSLWVGAMMVFMVLPALSTRDLSSSAPSWRVTQAGLVVPLLLGAGQVLVMLTVLNRGPALATPDWTALIGFLLLTSAAFTATVQYLNVRFGSSGRVVALVLLILQLTSAGGTYPVETSPSFFQKIGPYLPLYWAVTAMRRLLAEGATELVLQAALVMSLWLIVPLVFSTITAAHKRTFAMNTLHPALKLRPSTSSGAQWRPETIRAAVQLRAAVPVHRKEGGAPHMRTPDEDEHEDSTRRTRHCGTPGHHTPTSVRRHTVPDRRAGLRRHHRRRD